MFFFGLIVGVLLTLLGVGWLVYRSSRLEPAPVMSFAARRTVWDIERRTIHNLLAAEFAAQRAGSSDDEVIDGSAVDGRQP